MTDNLRTEAGSIDEILDNLTKIGAIADTLNDAEGMEESHRITARVIQEIANETAEMVSDLHYPADSKAD